jgi:hypothetical protein
LFYVVDWLPPDFGAVGQYAMLFARDIARSGRTVCLIGLTSGASTSTSEPCGSGTLRIQKLSALPYNRSSTAERLLWTIRTNARLIRHVVRQPGSRAGTLLFTGAPPFMLFFAVLAKTIRNMHLVYRITDFFPEVIIAERGRPSLMLRWLLSLTWLLRRQVGAFEALGADQAALLVKGGIAQDRIVLKRDVSPVEITGSDAPVKPPREMGGRLALLYSGNFGVAHEVDTLVEGLVMHHRRGSDRFALWLNATGSRADVVAERLARAAVPFARTAPVPIDRLAGLLLSADAHLITLRPGFSGIVLPSKIYACIQSKRPVIFIGPASSDVHLLCTQARDVSYVRIEPGDVAGFADALDRFPGGHFPAGRRQEMTVLGPSGRGHIQ